MAGLTALSEDQYAIQTQGYDIIPEQSDVHDKRKPAVPANIIEPESSSFPEYPIEPRSKISEKILPTKCLFCNLVSPALDANINHMSSMHGLFIPSPDRLSDVESFLGYLAIIVFDYKECLYCSLEKATVDAVQTHMRDKGHCMIKMDKESELLDFWDFSDTEEDGQIEGQKPVKLSDTEMRLPSGTVINSRSDTTQLRAKLGTEQLRSKVSQPKSKKAELRSITAEENPDAANAKRGRPSHDRRIAIRREMGLTGVSESQRRALRITERKMKSREALAKAAQRHAIEQQPVKTIYYKV